MLTMYAQLRGVPDDRIKGIVTDAIKLLNLEKWADSLCGNYRYKLQVFLHLFLLSVTTCLPCLILFLSALSIDMFVLRKVCSVNSEY